MPKFTAVLAAVVVGLALLAAPASAATPPIYPLPGGSADGVAKPDGLPLRLPWQTGTTHVLGAYRYNGLDAFGNSLGDHYATNCTNLSIAASVAQDCFALDVVGTSQYPFNTSTQIVDIFPGKVIFAGCAGPPGSGSTWQSYGNVVYIETKVSGYIYGALYTHLSTLKTSTGKTVAANKVIGMGGGTGLQADGSYSCTKNNNAGGEHLHFAIYRFDPKAADQKKWIDSATGLHKASWWTGGPRGGTAVVPEPLIGDQVYENFAWWNNGQTSGPDAGNSPAMTAVNLDASKGAPCSKVSTKAGIETCKWLSTATQTITDPTGTIQFQLRVTAPTGLKEVHLTAGYQVNGTDPWAEDTAGWNLSTFTPDAIWPILAVCQPPKSGFGTQVDSDGCSWSNMTRLGNKANGKVTAADISYSFPVSNQVQRVSWLPFAAPPWPTNGQCLPMKISFNVYDTAGGRKLAGDSVLDTGGCQTSASTLSGAGATSTNKVPNAQVVYLRPFSSPPNDITIDRYVIDLGSDNWGGDSLAVTSDDDAWVGTGGGVARVVPPSASPEFYTATGNQETIAIAPDGGVWLASNDPLGGKCYVVQVVPGEGSYIRYEYDGGCYFQSLVFTNDGTLWLSDAWQSRIGHIVGNDNPVWYVYGQPVSSLSGRYGTMAVGSDGNLWFLRADDNEVGRMSQQGDFTSFPLPGDAYAQGMTTGPDGAMWLNVGGQIVRLQTDGETASFTVPYSEGGLTSGPDGNLWFGLGDVYGGRGIDRMTPTGDITTFSQSGYDVARYWAPGTGNDVWYLVWTSTSGGGSYSVTLADVHLP